MSLASLAVLNLSPLFQALDTLQPFVAQAQEFAHDTGPWRVSAREGLLYVAPFIWREFVRVRVELRRHLERVE
jgi:hypothetical protein